MYIDIKHKYKSKTFYFNQYFGFLQTCDGKKTINYNNILSKKFEKASEIVDNPYKIKKTTHKKHDDLYISNTIYLYARLLVFCSRHFYPLIWALSYLRLNIFENSADSINVFCRIFPKNQHVLCLSRSIFAATTSKRFKDYGSMFIGVFHPSRHMHAWIIEDETNPCWFDNEWINFQPVAIMI